MNNKANTYLLETIIFIILNIVFFVVMLGFAIKSSGGIGQYEQAYAKQIALLVDSGKENMTFWIDMGKGIELSKKAKYDKQIIFANDFNEIVVKLDEKGGYGYKYFTNNKIEILQQPTLSKPYAVIKIGGEKNE